MSGRVAHFELPADDPERARKFYGAVFGWALNPMGSLDYTMVGTGPTDAQGNPKEPGYIGGGIARRSERLAHPVITILVDDLDRIEKTIEKNGGTVVQKKSPIGDGSIGFAGYFKDPEGNIVGLFQPSRRPSA